MGFVLICWTMLAPASAPEAWKHFCGAGFCGIFCSYVFIFNTQYYTDYAYPPVRSIAEVLHDLIYICACHLPNPIKQKNQASTTGHGTNIITGLAVGMKSTVAPCLAVSVAVISAYHLGRTSGLGDGHNAGLFGTAVATMGMLSTACFCLVLNSMGPCADNGTCSYFKYC